MKHKGKYCFCRVGSIGILYPVEEGLLYDKGCRIINEYGCRLIENDRKVITKLCKVEGTIE